MQTSGPSLRTNATSGFRQSGDSGWTEFQTDSPVDPSGRISNPTVYNQIISPPGISTPNTPDQTAGLLTWVSGDAITGKVNGEAVPTWLDRSGNATDFTQATGSKQPTYQTNVLAGKPVIRFDGTDDVMVATRQSANAIEYTIVARKRSATVNGARLTALRPEFGTSGLLHDAGTTWWYYATDVGGVDTSVSVGGTITNWTCLTVSIISADSAILYRDGTSVLTFNPWDHYLVNPAFVLGAATQVTDLPGDWDVAEFWAHDRVLTEQERGDLHSYVQDKYGITQADYSADLFGSPVLTAIAPSSALAPASILPPNSYSDTYADAYDLQFGVATVTGGTQTRVMEGIPSAEIFGRPALTIPTILLPGGIASPAAETQPNAVTGLTSWSKADAITGLSDGAAVSSWVDSSGNSRSLDQATGANQPTYRTAVLNGKPVVRFDGADWLTGARPVGTALSLIVVAVKRSATGYNSARLYDISPYGHASVLYEASAGTGWSYVAHWNGSAEVAVHLGGTLTNATIHTLAVTDATSAVAYLNGTSAATLDPLDTYTSATNLAVGADSNGSIPGDWDVAEVIAYDHALTAAERSGLHGYLQNKYAITVSDASPPIGVATVALSAAQTVSPSAVASGEAFGTATISQTVYPTSVTSAEALGSATLTPGPVTVSPTAVGTAEAFGSATFTAGAVTVSPTAIGSAEASGTAVLAPGAVVVAPAGISSAETFGAATIVAGTVTVSPTAIGSVETLGAATVSVGAVSVSPAGVASGEALGTVTVSAGSVTVAPAAIASGEALGAAVVTPGAVTLAPAGLVSGETHGTPVLTVGAVSVAPTGIASGEALGSAVVSSGGATVVPIGLSTAEAFGTAALTAGAVSISPSAIASGEAVGTAVISTLATVSPAGIGSSEALGSATVSSVAAVSPSGIASSEAGGAASVSAGAVSIAPAGLSSGEAFGAPVVTPGAVSLAPASISSGEAFGTAVLTPGTVTVSPAGIASGQAFGTAAVSGAGTLLPAGIASAEAFGTAVATPGAVTVSPGAVVSAEAHGSAVVTAGTATVSPTGLTTSEAFGAPTVAVGAVTVQPGSVLSGESHGVATVGGSYALTAVGISGAEAVGTLSLTAGTVLAPTGVSSAEAVPAPTVTPGAAAIVAASVASSEALGQLSIVSVVTLSGIATAEALGTLLLTPGVATIGPGGISSTGGFGSSVISGGELGVRRPTSTPVPRPYRDQMTDQFGDRWVYGVPRPAVTTSG